MTKMPRAYLTIDDTPSKNTNDFIDYLSANNMPALFFCRGDRLEINPAPVIRAIQKGFVVGNHAYTHSRSSELPFDDIVSEIVQTDLLIDTVYKEAGVIRPGKYFRFPHLDRGCGGWVVDYDNVKGIYKQPLVALFSEGLNVSLSPPHEEQKQKKNMLQLFLKQNDFKVPFTGVKLDWYANTEMIEAVDCMFTYSTSDWMLSRKHAGKWLYKSLSDLKRKIDLDEALKDRDSHHIILAHDQDDLFEVTIALLTHFVDKGYRFLEI